MMDKQIEEAIVRASLGVEADTSDKRLSGLARHHLSLWFEHKRPIDYDTAMLLFELEQNRGL